MCSHQMAPSSHLYLPDVHIAGFRLPICYYDIASDSLRQGYQY